MSATLALLDDGPWAVLFGNGVKGAALPPAIAATLKATACRYLVYVDTSYGGAISVLCDEIDLTFTPEATSPTT